MDISTLTQLVNAETMKDLASIDSIEKEDLKGNVLNSEETDRKIEERRRAVTAESQSRSVGLNSPSTQTPKSTTVIRSSEPQPQRVYNNPYPYNNIYNKTVKTVESKAKDFSDNIFKKAEESVNKEYKYREDIRKDNWNIFELEEKAKLSKEKPRKKKKKIVSDESKLLLLKMGAYSLKALMELIYIETNKD